MPKPPAAPIDDLGDRLVDEAAALVRTWLAAAKGTQTRNDRRDDGRFRALTGDPGSVAFTMAFADRVVRPDDDAVAAAQLRELVGGPAPRFLSAFDRVQLRAGALASRAVPGIVMPLVRRRLRQLVGPLIAERSDPALTRHLDDLRRDGFSVNANLLGELVLGDDEATRRRDDIVDLLARPDITYVSVKASSVASQLSMWGYEDSLDRVVERLRPVLAAAAVHEPRKFVNFDMEEYKDLRLTLDAFVRLLDEPAFRDLEAGIVLQAYLPDSAAALDELTEWAVRRVEGGGAPVKVRIVKGANLAMERVEAELHGWVQAPYASKAETDANYKRMVDRALDPQRVGALRVGVASHNLFDVAWAHLLAEARGVADRVQFEMLQGMAPGIARTVRDDAGGLLLYTPVVDAADFDSALAYLFRRLEENSSGENFLRHLFELDRDPSAFDEQRARFERAVADRWIVSDQPRRHQPGPSAGPAFENAADTDPTDAAARAEVLCAVADRCLPELPAELDVDGVDEAVARAVAGGAAWRSMPLTERRRLLRAAADEIEARRPQLVAGMAHEAAKTLAEGDAEVSEAVDFARYYAERAGDLGDPRGAGDGASFDPFGVVAVVPPWNFPMAIPIGGALAALAAGGAAILKPAPQTPACALAVCEACWTAGIPRDALQYARVPEDAAGERLVGHPDVGAIVLTGSLETAELFGRFAPDTPLLAETSGKNAIVVMPDADLDLAVADLVRSAFGHAGQKCSAASLAILVGDVATSDRFRRQLADATASLRVAPSTDPAAAVGPLVGGPSDKLRRALTELRDGERWLVEPQLVDAATNLWSPGVLDGVRPGSWFHRTECFGPVLGLMAAADLDEAIALQDGTDFGLTGGIHTLDPANVDHWLERVEVGNAYVNRHITGAIVRRQPFGGWKGSSVGPGAKAGGPNYVAQLGRWRDDGLPTIGRVPSARVGAIVATVASWLDADERAWLGAAVRSDAYWWTTEFGVEHDPSGLVCESNVFRYRPFTDLEVRVEADAALRDVARVVAAVAATGARARVSVDPTHPGLPDRFDPRVERGTTAAGRFAAERPARVRVVGTPAPELLALPVAIHVDVRPPVANGRVELLRYVREQAVSRTLHRFGNLVGTSAGGDGNAGNPPFSGRSG